MYLATVAGDTSMPSLSNSPWIFGAPQRGFQELETFAMPADYGLRFHNDEGLGPVPPNPGQYNPEQAICFVQSLTLRGALKDSQLLSESQILEDQDSTGF